MENKSLKQETPEVIIRSIHNIHGSLPVVMDADSPTGYPDGQSNRRKRRELERQNKKRK